MSNDIYPAPPPTYTEATDETTEVKDETIPRGKSTKPAEPEPHEATNIQNSANSSSIPITTAVQPTVVTTFTRTPTQCICPKCRAPVLTRLEHTTGLLTWLVCLGLLVFGLWLGCCLIPFCIDDLKNVQHYCPNCNTFIGEFRPL